MPVYFEFQVEKRVAVDSAVAPHYPDVLKATKLNGEVLAQFIVDTTGRADMSSFKVLRSTHDLFTQAVRAVLPPIASGPRKSAGAR